MTTIHPIPAHDSPLARAAADFCRRADTACETTTATSASSQVWQRVRGAGSSPWLDSADLAANRAAWTSEFDGLTTNNSLLNDEVQKGRFDGVVGPAVEVLRSADPELSERATVLELATIVNALHGLDLARTFDADVSVELHTDLAHDVEGTYELGRRLHGICPERFVVKVALTPEGLVAARRLERDGVRVNCTLGFSCRQNELIARFAQPHFVNVFLGRIDAFYDAGELRAEEPLGPGEAATITSQRMLRELEASPRPRQIAASMRSAAQVSSLAGVDVLTMPVQVASEFAANGSAEVLEDRTREAPDLEPLTGSDDVTAARADVFFLSDPAARVAAEQLRHRPLEVLDGDRVRAVLADSGLGDLFPKLTDDDRARIAADGKLPDRAYWQDRVAAGECAWDALLCEAGLARFAADQAELDAHLRGLLR